MRRCGADNRDTTRTVAALSDRMTDAPEGHAVPAQIATAIAGIPKALIPASLKALDRLIGATVDIPAAWLAQHKAKIDAQTQAYAAVEAAIAKAAAAEAGADPQIIERAVEVLVRQSYRKQKNKEAVSAAMIEDLRSTAEPDVGAPNEAAPSIDDDWLNVFERYAEDASTERMQQLWARVLAGEIRTPGKFSMRTLRFLSEFSQADALTFASFCDSAFGDTAPDKLVKPEGLKDIRQLIYLESAGLIQGASGLGLSRTVTFNQTGNAFLREGSLLLMLSGTPGTSFQEGIVALTPLGQELISLLPGRDARAAARRVALTMKRAEIKSAYIAVLVGDRASPIEVLWQEQEPRPPTGG